MAALFAGSPGFSSSVPVSTIPQTGQTDTMSLSLGTGDALSFSYAFPFDTLTNATLEFYVKPTSLGTEQDIFWTTTGSGDANRFVSTSVSIARGNFSWITASQAVLCTL